MAPDRKFAAAEAGALQMTLIMAAKQVDGSTEDRTSTSDLPAPFISMRPPTAGAAHCGTAVRHASADKGSKRHVSG